MAQEITENIFARFDYIYDKTNNFSGICPNECSLCESRENLLLLPYENNYIQNIIPKSLRNKFNEFRKDEQGNYIELKSPPCKMLGKNNKCNIYHYRPFDCRSFPFVPKFVLNSSKINFYLAKNYCCISKKLPKYFIDETIRCWYLLLPFLQEKWKLKYNDINSHTYTLENSLIQ